MILWFCDSMILWWQCPRPGTTVCQAQASVLLPGTPDQAFIALEREERHRLCRSAAGPQARTACVRAPGRETLGAGTLAGMSPTACCGLRGTPLCPHPGLGGQQSPLAPTGDSLSASSGIHRTRLTCRVSTETPQHHSNCGTVRSVL